MPQGPGTYGSKVGRPKKKSDASYTPFKMKGHTLPGINQRSEGNTDLPDGRSGSSPFQKDEKPKHELASYPKGSTKESRAKSRSQYDISKTTAKGINERIASLEKRWDETSDKAKKVSKGDYDKVMKKLTNTRKAHELSEQSRKEHIRTREEKGEKVNPRAITTRHQS